MYINTCHNHTSPVFLLVICLNISNVVSVYSIMNFTLRRQKLKSRLIRL